MFKQNVIGRAGLFLGISVLAGACGAGEIGDAAGAPRLGAGYNDDVPTCPGASPDVSASDGWLSSEASLAAIDALYFEFKARPTAANLDGLLAVGAEDIDDFTKAAITVRFADDGFVDVADGDFYTSDVSYAYEPGVWYTVAVSADIAAQTYDVGIGRCGEPQETLIKGASFRQEANVSDELSTWAVWSSQGAALELSTPTWMASGGCAPATCESLGQECGEPSNGCGGRLDCGGCASGQACASGLCVDSSTPPPPVSGEGWWNSVPQPSPANTGPNNPGLLSPANAPPSVITQNGATYENFTAGSITINADNVTLRNFRISNPGTYGIVVSSGSSNVLLEHGEITGTVESAGILGAGWTGRYLYLHDYKGDAIKAQNWSSSSGPTVLEYSYLHNFGIGASAPHTDGTQGAEGGQMNDMTIRYNYCDMDDLGSCNRCWFFSSSSHSDIDVQYNWNACKGNYVFANNPVGDMLINNNLVYCNASHSGLVEGSGTWGTNNRWMDTKEVIPSPGLTCGTR